MIYYPREIPPNTPAPIAACIYQDAGFRTIPISPATKKAARKGFGTSRPNYCTPPEDFRENEWIGILFGPSPLGIHIGGLHMFGVDLDGGMTVEKLELHTGPLPPTLTSKSRRHLYYWIQPESWPNPKQGRDVFHTRDATGEGVDTRPHAGGYFRELGDWDDGFDPRRIVMLPDRALAAFKPAHVGRPKGECIIPLDWARPEGDTEITPLLDRAAALLQSIWPQPGQGGGHDLGLALGGVLADAHATLDELAYLGDLISWYAKAPPIGDEVVASAATRRARVRASHTYGWPTLTRILLSKAPQDTHSQAIVKLRLEQFADIIPGLRPFPLKTAAAKRLAAKKATASVEAEKATAARRSEPSGRQESQTDE